MSKLGSEPRFLPFSLFPLRSSVPNDKREPSRITDAIRGFLDQSGLAGRVAQASIIEAWPQLVGPVVAEATKALAVAADGTLFVAVRTPAWMTELAMMEREILAAINRQQGIGRIARIRWQIARER